MGSIADFAVLVLTAGYCAFIIYRGQKRKKNGKGSGCDGCCGSCSGCSACSAGLTAGKEKKGR